METVGARGATWPNLGPTWEVFLEEAEPCSEWGRTCVDLPRNQNLHDEGSSIVSDLTSSPTYVPLHTHGGPVNDDEDNDGDDGRGTSCLV